MAHTNQTPNYELSQFLGTDKPAWLVDYNGDMEKIDLGLKAAKDVADAAKTEADQGAIDIAAVTITANSADAKASGAISDLADVYDSTSTYNVGDFVIYSNILYRCITTITVPESSDGAHWARTTVEEIITQINSDLSGKLDKPTEVDCSQCTSLIQVASLVNSPSVIGYGRVGALDNTPLGSLLSNVAASYAYTTITYVSSRLLKLEAVDVANIQTGGLFTGYIFFNDNNIWAWTLWANVRS